MWSKILSPLKIRVEITILLICFAVSFIYSLSFIAKYAAPWQEIFTSLGSVVVESLLIYGLILLLRIAWRIMSHLRHK
ncbi:MAG: hypothetical protein IKM03_05210 [Alistipes sp.]|nr:hypothetical protein [Alistipes sp.]